MKKKSIIVILSVIILAIISSLLYVSYGFITSKIEGNSSAKKFANLSQVLRLEYSDGSEKLSTALDSYFIPGSKLTKTFTITNKGNVNIDFSINLKNIINDFEREDDLVYEIKSNDVILNSGTFPKSNYAILPNETINIDESKTYTLTIEYLTSTENQIIDNGKVIDAEIVIDEDVKTFSKFQILGNSIQDDNGNGAASPTNPIEIQSLGVKTKNIFDLKDFYESYLPYQSTILQSEFVNLKEEGFTEPELKNVIALKIPAYLTVEGRALKYMEGKFKSNTQYTISFNGYDIPGSDNLTGMVIYLYYTDGTFENLTRTRKRNEWYTVEFTSQKNKTISHIQIPTYGTGNAFTYLYDFQIEEGTVKSEYENPGYEINLKATGKNLFDIEDFAETYAPYQINYVSPPSFEVFDGKEVLKMYGTVSAEGRALKYMQGKFKENTQYTISLNYYEILSTANGLPGIIIRIYYTDNTYIDLYAYGAAPNTWHLKTYVTTAGKTVDCIKLSYSTGVAITYLNNFQIEEGTTATAYEPYSEENYDIYLDEPLRKSGTCETCADYIELVDKKLYNNVFADNISLDKLKNYTSASSSERYSLGFLAYYNSKPENTPINVSNYVGKQYTMDNAASYAQGYAQGTQLKWLLAPTYAQLIAPTGYTISSFFNENSSLYPNGWSFQYALANSKVSDIDTPNVLSIGQDKIHFSACDTNDVCASDIIVEYTK